MRARFTLASGLGIAILGSLIASAAYLRLAATLEQASTDFARHEAIEVATAIASVSSIEAASEHIRGLEGRLFPEEGVEALDVFAVDGAPAVWLPSDRPAPPFWAEGLRSARSGSMPVEVVRAPGAPHASTRAALLVEHDRAPRWLVVAQVSRVKLEDELASLARSLVIWLSVAVGTAVLGSFGLLTLALRPVQQLVKGARSIVDEGVGGKRLASPAEGSELAELARVLNLMLSQTEETFEQLRRFAANASHELRTPLTRMTGEAEVALRSGDPEAARAALGSTLEELAILKRLMDGLLELSRGSNRDTRTQSSFELGGIVADLAGEARVLGETRGIAVELPAPATAPVFVRGSRDLVGRAVWNMLDNALKHVPAGERVRVTFAAHPTHAEVIVEDTGPGIPAELEPRLFEAFARGADSSGPAGHGLGLALGRTIARRYGGELSFERPSGRGARFVLRLPRASS